MENGSFLFMVEGDATTTCSHVKMSKSSTINGGWVWGLGGCGRRSGPKRRGGQGERFNCPAYTSSILNFKGEIDNCVALLGTTAEQREANYIYKKLSKNLKQYVLCEFQNHEDAIFLVKYLKYLMTVLDTSIPTALFKQDKKDPIMITIQTE